jgi:Cu/Ag efflux protein CusF
MIVRVWLISGIVLVVVAWVLMVPLSPPTTQQISTSMIKGYRSDGLMPGAGAIEMSDKVGHDVFEVPPTDAIYLKEAMAAAEAMPGMESMTDMEQHGSEAEAAHTAEDTHAMAKQMETMPQQASQAMPGAAHPEPPPTTDKRSDDKDEHRHDDSGRGHADKDAEGHAKETMSAMPGHADEGGHGSGGEAVGLSILAQGHSDAVAKAAGGLAITKTVELTMNEWGYRPNHVMVNPGDVIRLIVRHTGNTPHEFMLMTGPAMNAVDYRLQRADWNLLEHEAIFEKPVVLPGDSFEMLLKVHKPGMWMYMCMFPYHMQLGMMGMLMTEGMSMDMSMMGHAMAAQSSGIFEGKGTVIAIVADKRQIVLDHEEIEGFMGAMTMGYPVASEALLQGLNSGDTVKFQLDAAKNEIIAVERLK